MAQQYKVSGRATSVYKKGAWFCVKYHNTEVVKFTPKTIVLNTGGWKSNTTKTRMNQASNQFNLGYNVFQTKGKWYVRFKRKDYPFKGRTMTLRR